MDILLPECIAVVNKRLPLILFNGTESLTPTTPQNLLALINLKFHQLFLESPPLISGSYRFSYRHNSTTLCCRRIAIDVLLLSRWRSLPRVAMPTFPASSALLPTASLTGFAICSRFYEDLSGRVCVKSKGKRF